MVGLVLAVVLGAAARAAKVALVVSVEVVGLVLVVVKGAAAVVLVISVEVLVV